jgi:hypothetical protein
MRLVGTSFLQSGPGIWLNNYLAHNQMTLELVSVTSASFEVELASKDNVENDRVQNKWNCNDNEQD